MPDLDQARVLLRLAGRDLQTIDAMRDSEPFGDEAFGFHAQQAVEKSLKAWLCLHGIEYPHTHDLALLYELLESAGARDLVQFDPLTDLSAFAVQFRYDIYDDEPLDRNGIGKQAARLVQHVDELLRRQTDATQAR